MLRIYSPEDRVPVKEVRELVLRIRKARQLTQGQLANRLDISRKLIERIEQLAVGTVEGSIARKLQEFERA